MKILVFVGVLGQGGTEKAACRWAAGLRSRGHEVTLISFRDGPRRIDLTSCGVAAVISRRSADAVANEVRNSSPDVIHAHVPGYPHEGDILGDALTFISRKIPVVQTNVFGRLENPPEDLWTDFRLFISWTSCVQAARRAFLPLNDCFFRRRSVAVYPLDRVDPVSPCERETFRRTIGVAPDETLFGRLSRPDPHKWTDLALDAFQIALRRDAKIKLLLREPPSEIGLRLRSSPDAARFVILPATSDNEELRKTMSALDVVLHTSSIGESFGYGIAEPMNLGKPAVTHSIPWGDQAQIELVRNGECGFVASTPAKMADAILQIAHDSSLREKMGKEAQRHIRYLANADISTRRVEAIFEAVLSGRENPFSEQDIVVANQTAQYLDTHQFGFTPREQTALRAVYYRTRFNEWRKEMRLRWAKRFGLSRIANRSNL